MFVIWLGFCAVIGCLCRQVVVRLQPKPLVKQVPAVNWTQLQRISLRHRHMFLLSVAWPGMQRLPAGVFCYSSLVAGAASKYGTLDCCI